jgi:hypothetical protein
LEKQPKLLRLDIQFFAAGQTGVDQMIVPEVMSAMISAELPKALKFAPLAVIDRTLVGQPGDTITAPVYKYIGPAVDVAEFGAIPIEQLTTSSTSVTIKKAGKGVEISDEAVLSGIGDPIGEGNKQLKMSIADKVDNDSITAIKTATITAGAVGTAIDVALDDALVAFDEEEFQGTVFAIVSPKGYASLRRSAGFQRSTALGDQVTMTGQVGDYLGATVVISRKLVDGEAYLVKPGALGLLMKRDVLVEKDRDILHKTTIVTADEHYGAYLKDNTKVVKVTHAPLA